ncbi:alpha/beta hydrolase [Hymenobacter puniceus]|uniref:alpha/beta hydrolase n=1 Tax=Hymenobacter sp. BT190 TaxID=2763505 RepID=UPI0021C688E3|nr:alpha/beta hydrolase-fold protein [Hymenobacter sp. BT190]
MTFLSSAIRLMLAAALVTCFPLAVSAQNAASVSNALTIGQTFTLNSRVLSETRRINVYLPAGYAEQGTERLPVLYMPDGGMGEDFLHVAGLMQVLIGNGTMRPFLLVGIENTERRRDLTGPTTNEKDKKIAPRVGGSVAFRQFLRTELMPEIKRRYRTTDEKAIVGESLAGLFVVETLFLEPDLFDTYLAFDPSLWWNNELLVQQVPALLAAYKGSPKTLLLATSNEPEIVAGTGRLTRALQASANQVISWNYVPMPQETHLTIYHPAALHAFRAVFKPRPAVPAK